jgi:hypothetical protein
MKTYHGFSILNEIKEDENFKAFMSKYYKLRQKADDEGFTVQ